MAHPSTQESTAQDRFAPRPQSRVQHPPWSRDAVLYQVNTRQFTPAGTLDAAREQLPRLAQLGVRIIWLMPVHEIGVVNRKGHLGSPYAVRDYYSVSSELGTFEDLRAFVAEAHRLGLQVILDWVANHTSWDNTLMEEHPDWYDRDPVGRLRPTPWWDWDDVIDLDYSRPELRRYMTEALCYWVREADIDGYRCDVAGYVPLDFWETAREELEAIKPVFMLAEWEARDLHVAAFDASYAWSWNETMHLIATGRADVSRLHVYYSWNEKAYPRDVMRMTFVSNHDKNSWEGTEYEQFGDAVDAAVVLSVVGEGIPLVYNGQESGNDRRLDFFDRDAIEWRDHPMGELYRRLIALKRNCPPLHNGAWGARMHEVVNDRLTQVLSFVRDDGSQRVFGVFNLSPEPVEVTFSGPLHAGRYTEPQLDPRTEVASGPVELAEQERMSLAPWSYRVLVGDSPASTSSGAR